MAVEWNKDENEYIQRLNIYTVRGIVNSLRCDNDYGDGIGMRIKYKTQRK